jgi:4-amino-4-deoxy-L-arabinose transferase-like glycosyltransferase
MSEKLKTYFSPIHTYLWLLSIVCLISSVWFFMQPNLVFAWEYADYLNKTLFLQFNQTSNKVSGFFLLIIGIFLQVLYSGIKPSNQDSWKDFANGWSLSTIVKPTYFSQALLGSISFGIALFLIPKMKDSPIIIGLWLFSIFILTKIMWEMEKTSGTDISWLRINRLDVGILAGLGFWGLLFGALLLSNIPARFIGDEGSFFENGKAIVESSRSVSWFGQGVYSFPIFTTILQGWLMKLVGLNFWGWRFSALIPAVCTVVPLYILVKEQFRRSWAILSCLLMLSSGYFLAFARLGYISSQSIFVATAFYCCLWLAYKHKSLFMLWCAGLMAGFGFYVYSAAIIGFFQVALLLPLLLIFRQLPIKNFLGVATVLLVSILLMLLPRVIHGSTLGVEGSMLHKISESFLGNSFFGREFYSEAELYKYFPPYPVGNQTLFFNPEIYAIFLLRGTILTFLNYFYEVGHGGENFVWVALSGGAVCAVFFGFGFANCLRNIRNATAQLLLLWLAIASLTLSITNTYPPRPTHMISVIPVVAIIVCIGFFEGVRQVKEHTTSWFSKESVKWVTILSVIVMGFAIWQNYDGYYGVLAKKYPNTFQQFMLFTTINNQRGVNIVVAETTPQNYDVLYFIQRGIIKDVSLLQENLQDFSWVSKYLQQPTLIFVEANSQTLLKEQLLANGFVIKKTTEAFQENKAPLGVIFGNFEFTNIPKLTFGEAYKSIQKIQLLIPLGILAGIATFALYPFLFSTRNLFWGSQRVLDKPISSRTTGSRYLDIELKFRMGFSNSPKINVSIERDDGER